MDDVPTTGNVTVLLRRAREGDPGAEDALYASVFAHLHQIADALMRSERADHSLQPTALVGEAWLRLFGAGVDWQDRAHFYRVAARAMRRALCDHARARNTRKRDGGPRVPLDAAVDAWEEMPYELLDLDDALDALAVQDPQLAQIVELRFFGGLTLEETGKVLGISLQKAHRSWLFARGWLHERLTAGDEE